MSSLPLEAAEILDGSSDDIDEVMRTMSEAFDPDFGESWTRSQTEGIFQHNGSWLNLARCKGVPAGFALSRVIADEAELLLLAVRPARRRAGMGIALLERTITDAAKRGAGRLHLEVRDRNAAVALYRSAGFEEVGRRANYYHGRNGTSFDALTFAIRLSA